MSLRKVFAVLLFTFAASLHCEAATKKEGEAIKTAAQLNNASLAQEVYFEKNSSNLTSDARKLLTELLEKARAQGQIEHVRVIAWADQNLPAGKKQLDKNQRQLADHRAFEVKNFFFDKAHGVSIDTFNMAEEPTALEKLANDKDEKIKRSLEQAGLAGDGIKVSNPSRAVVLVTLK